MKDDKAESSVLVMVIVFFVLLALTINYTSQNDEKPLDDMYDNLDDYFEEKNMEFLNNSNLSDPDVANNRGGPFWTAITSTLKLAYDYTIGAVVNTVSSGAEFLYNIMFFQYETMDVLGPIQLMIGIIAWFVIGIVFAGIIRGVRIIG